MVIVSNGQSQARKPWDPLPIEKPGDSSPEPLFCSVGKALTAWERLDGMQAALFSTLVQSRCGSAERGYGTLQSLQGRNEMVKEAAKAVLPEGQLLDQTVDALINIARYHPRRNEIAHGYVSHFTSKKQGEAEIDNGHYLIPGLFVTRKRANTEKIYSSISSIEELDELPQPAELVAFAYTAKQIDYYTQQFLAVRSNLCDLNLQIWEYCREKWPFQLPT
jgi:hypothetical protein